MILKVGERYVQHLNEVCDQNEEFNAKNMMTKFTLEAIACCGFGIDANAFCDEEGTFVKMVI